MASTGSMSTLRARMTPFLAILRHDLRTFRGSWLVWVWTAAALVLSLLVTSGNWKELPHADLIAVVLIPFLVFPWFLVVMVLGVSPVSGSRAESLADGILSRPVARYEYLLAAWAARVLLVLGVYVVATLPWIVLVVLTKPPGMGDPVTLYGILAVLSVVGLVITLQVSLAFLLGTLLRNPLHAMVLLLVVWYPINFVLDNFRLEEFSPVSLARAAPTLLEQPPPWHVEETPEESKPKSPFAVVDDVAHFLETFGGQPEKSADEFPDFSLLRVLFGYGVPTVLSIGLATWCFCRRDL